MQSECTCAAGRGGARGGGQSVSRHKGRVGGWEGGRGAVIVSDLRGAPVKFDTELRVHGESASGSDGRSVGGQWEVSGRSDCRKRRKPGGR
jgi:hypothetical protein